MVSTARTKAGNIEYIQYDGTESCADEIIQWTDGTLNPAYRLGGPDPYQRDVLKITQWPEEPVNIPDPNQRPARTIESIRPVLFNEYVIKHTSNIISKMKPKEFEQLCVESGCPRSVQ